MNNERPAAGRPADFLKFGMCPKKREMKEMKKMKKMKEMKNESPAAGRLAKLLENWDFSSVICGYFGWSAAPGRVVRPHKARAQKSPK